MIKVLQVFNRLNQGGIEHVVINLMKNMDSSQVEFHFAMMSGQRGLLDDQVKAMGGKIYYFSSGDKSLSNVRHNLEDIIKNYGPFHVVHSHVYFFSGYVLYIAKKMGVPVRIAHAHDVYKGEQRNFKRKVYEYVMQQMINKYATYKFGVSQAAIKHVFGKKTANAFVVNNGINISSYVVNDQIRKQYRNWLGVKNNETLLCNVGRFESQKDHDYLISIFSSLQKINSQFKLVLVGNGSLKNKIEKRVFALNLKDKVIFLQNRNDINNILMAADMFIMPSKYEGLPLSLVEAQASGMTCLISKNITDEIKICPNVYSLRKDSINKWVNFMINHRYDQRLDNAKRLDKAGFNEKSIARFVERKYSSVFSGNYIK